MRDPIAERIRLGDEQAFELLFHKYFVRLCAFVNKFLNDPQESREVVQEVFLRLWESRQDINPERSLKGYIFMIAQNTSLNRLRRSKVENRYAEIYRLVYLKHNLEFSAYDSIFLKELELNIEAAVEKLPPQCRKIYKYSRVEGMKNQEIADLLNISIKTVETQLSKALRNLRSELSEYSVCLILIALTFWN